MCKGIFSPKARIVSLLLFIILVSQLGFVSNSRAFIIEVFPACPTDEDEVLIRVKGALPDGCWSMSGYDCLPIEGYQINIVIYTLDEWEPGLGCADWEVPYEAFCACGVLDAGHYFVTVTENHDSQRYPTPDIGNFEFDVGAPVQVQYSGWGTIKAIYR